MEWWALISAYRILLASQQPFPSLPTEMLSLLKVNRIGLLLFVSGACSLLFQTAWFREFRLVFGATTLASSAVLTIFMGGLGLGNTVLGRLADRSNSPLLLYAKLELLISLLCALSPFMIDGVRWAYILLGGQETLGVFGASVFRLLGTCMVLGIPTFLMGGTLPAAAKASTATDDLGRKNIGLLYGLNTLGAVVGVLLGTFFLLEAIGTRFTLWVACLFNVSNSLAAWWISNTTLKTVLTSPVQRSHNIKQNTRDIPPTLVARNQPIHPTIVYSAAAITGCIFFLMEMVWFRMLSPILGGSTFTFGLILTIALTGIGIGGTLYSAVYAHREPTLHAFVFTLALEAVAIGYPFALGDDIAVFALAIRQLEVLGFFGIALSWASITTIVVFPAAVVSGFQFPLMIGLLGQADKDIGKQLGQAFGWNTIGSMLGSLAGGFGLISILSATGVWKFAVIVLALYGATILVYGCSKTKFASTASTTVLLLLAIYLVLFEGPTAVWRHGAIGAGRAIMPKTQNALIEWSNDIRRKILWQADGRESTVAIASDASLGFLVNGKSDGNAVGDAGTQIMLGVLPAILHPNPQRGVVVGLGTGESAGWLASLPFIEHVDVIELEPVVAKMAELCKPINHDVLNNPKVNVIQNDAREFLQTTANHYDLIASEPSNPYRAGVSSLYTKEFYQSAAQRLNPNGIFAQWLQGYEVSSSSVGMVLTTLHSVFPFIEMWQTQGGDMVLICSSSPITYSLASIAEKLVLPAVATATETAWRTSSVNSFLSHLIAADEYVNRVAMQSHSLVNTDDKNSLEYAFARTVGFLREFEIEQIRWQANSIGLRWPSRYVSQLDRQAIDDHSIALAVFSKQPVQFAANKSPRAAVWEAIQEDRTKDAILLLDRTAEPPRDLTEKLLVGLAFANGLDSRLPELLKEISRVSPADADALACIVSFQAADLKRTSQALVRLFGRLSETPIVSEPLLFRCLLIAEDVAQRSPEDAESLFQSLNRPFCLWVADQKRYQTAIKISRRVSPAATCDAFLQLEPFPIWNKEMLKLRSDAYRHVSHPMTTQAERDLAKCGEASDEDLLALP